MPEFYYKSAGTWRKAKELYYKSGGSWLKAKEVWYKSGGTWRQVFNSFAIVNPLAGGTYTDNDTAPGAAACTMSVGSDGYIGFVGSASGDLGGQLWGAPQTAGIGVAYWVRVTLTTGSFSTSAGSTWLQLNVARNWTRNRPTGGIGSTSCTCTVEIATDSGGVNVVTSGSFTLGAVHS